MSIEGQSHPGLAVRELELTSNYFIDCPGWEESGGDVK